MIPALINTAGLGFLNHDRQAISISGPHLLHDNMCVYLARNIFSFLNHREINDMREILWEKFLEQATHGETDRLKDFVYLHGIHGLLAEFENWLLENKHL